MSVTVNLPDDAEVARFYGRKAREGIAGAGGLVNLVGLAKHWGCSKSTAFWWTQRDGFPEAIRYEGQAGAVKMWLVAEVDAFREAYRDG
jgi:hypothetical protein